MVDQYNKYPVDGGNQGQTHVSHVSIGSQDVEDSIRVPLKFMEVISAGWIGQKICDFSWRWIFMEHIKVLK